MKSQFVNILDKIITAGLIVKWDRDLQRRPNVTRRTFEEHAYSMNDFGGIVIYLSLIIVGSIAAFIGEIIIYHQRHTIYANRFINKFWELCDKWVCGKRHYFLLDQPQRQTQTKN